MIMKAKKLSVEPVPENAVNTATSHKFNSVSEILNDPYFISQVGKNIEELIKNRVTRPQSRIGYHYIRDWYDRLCDAEGLNSQFFIENIEKVWNKTSSLSSEIRNVIKYICDRSFQETLIYYSEQKNS